MRRPRTFVAFIGGLIIGILTGFVPGEIVSGLQEWSTRGGPDTDEPDSGGHRSGKRRRGRPRRR